MSERQVKGYASPVFNIDFAFAKGAANHSTCTMTVKDEKGAAIGEIQPMLVYISDSAVGAGLAAVSPTNLAAGAKGTYLNELTANTSALCLTDSNGQFALDITDAVTQVYYVCATPMAGQSGFVAVSRIMSAADFGV